MELGTDDWHWGVRVCTARYTYVGGRGGRAGYNGREEWEHVGWVRVCRRRAEPMAMCPGPVHPTAPSNSPIPCRMRARVLPSHILSHMDRRICMSQLSL